jgi:hypothetical protein
VSGGAGRLPWSACGVMRLKIALIIFDRTRVV